MLGPFIITAVTEGSAAEVLPDTDDVLTGCDGSTSAAGFTTTVEAVSIPGLPEGSLAVSGSKFDDAGAGVDFTIVASGTNEVSVLVFAVTPLGEVDDVVIADAVAAMVDRAPATAS